MCDNRIDLLYGLCFNQMVRYKLSPTYVEKRILDETVSCVKSYLLQFVEELKQKVSIESKRYTESYLTWNPDFYKKEGEEKEKMVVEFENKIKDATSNEFLGIDFSKTGNDIDTLYPDVLPTSLVRETLWNQWNKIKDKHA